MAVRFRKSVKLGKGVKLNVSQGGISATVGIPGLSVNIGKNGIYRTVSIPGTGISSREKVSDLPWGSTAGSRSGFGSRGACSRAASGGSARRTSSRANASGVAVDPEQARRAAEALAQANAVDTEIVEVYRSSPDVPSRDDYEQVLSSLRPEPYVPEPFAQPRPERAQLRRELDQEAESQVKGLPWKRNKLRAQYVDERLDARFAEASRAWEEAKAAHEAEERKKADEANERAGREVARARHVLEGLLAGDVDAVENAAQMAIESCKLPLEMDVQLEFRPETGTMMADVDLPEIEDLPQQTTSQLKSGALKTKDKTQKVLRAEYAQCIFGLAEFVAASALAASPCVLRAVVSGRTQRRNTVGDLVDDYLYSIRFDRTGFEVRDFRQEDPEEFCMRFENRVRVSTTKVFKAIEPYES